MILKDFADALSAYNLLSEVAGDMDTVITGVEYNSKKIKPGYLFVCKGNYFKEEYLIEAINNGAAAYVSENFYNSVSKKFPSIRTSDIRAALAQIACLYYDNPSKKLKLTGITGTKGKTTTAYMIKSIMESKCNKWGIISSIEVDTGKKTTPATNTTPESLDLQRYFNEMLQNGVKGAAVEVSSQGLQYHRVDGCHFENVIFLNIGEDHISPKEHKDFNEYFEAKCKIFELCRIGIINGDDQNYELIAEKAKAKRIVTFGFSDYCDFMAYDVAKKGKNFVFSVRSPYFISQFEISMFGSFNIYNALAAISASALMNVSPEDIAKGLIKARAKGRVEVFEKNAITVIVDYAHNKLSFENLLKAIKEEYPKRRIVTVYGCPGGKAFLRRKDMGSISARLADFTYLTAEDPNFENVSDIMDEIALHIEQNGGKYDKVNDREEAIKKSVLSALDDDVVIITGKGQEEFQNIKGESVYFPGDVNLAQKYLDLRGKI